MEEKIRKGIFAVTTRDGVKHTGTLSSCASWIYTKGPRGSKIGYLAGGAIVALNNTEKAWVADAMEDAE